MPSFNEITGARISSGVHVKGADKDKFAQGWELLWGKKEEVVEDQYKLICPDCQADRLLEYCKNKSGCTFVAEAQDMTEQEARQAIADMTQEERLNLLQG